MDPFRHIAVVAGGNSSERDISLRSGKAVTHALKAKGLKVTCLDVRSDVLRMVKESGATFVFNAMHGAFGEDGGLQRLLEREGVPFSGSSSRACRLSMDKIASRQLFRRQGLDVPRAIILERSHAADLGALKLPVFVKPCVGGSSIGVSLVQNSNELAAALERAFCEDRRVLVEERVVGRELTAGVLGERVLPLLEIIPKRRYYDYIAKYCDSGTVYTRPEDLSASDRHAIISCALGAHHALGMGGFSRVDFIWTGERAVVLEVNAIPGMTEKSLLPKMAGFAGIPFGDLCIRMMETSLAMPKVIQY